MDIRKPVYINITALTIIKIILVLALFYFLYLIRNILVVLFVSLVLSSALDPWVDWLQKRRIPRGVSMLFVYVILLAVFGTAVFLIYTPIVEQATELVNRMPQILDKVVSGVSILKEFTVRHGILDSLKTALADYGSDLQSFAAGGVFSTVSGIVGGVVTFFLILVITFYMVVEENAMKKLVWSVAPEKYQVYIMHLIGRMQKKVGLWLRGQLILSVIIFVLTYIGLSILGIKYALILALIAGLTEFVPYLGPSLASVPAIFLAFTQSGFMLALSTATLYYVVQMVENHIVVPKMMQKVVGLNPIISIAVLLIGFRIAGIAGAVMSIPVTTALGVFLKDVFDRRVMDNWEAEE